MASNDFELSLEFATKVYRYMKDGMSIETFMQKFGYSMNELSGIIELCNLHGKQITLDKSGDTIVFRKGPYKRIITSKPSIDDSKLTHIEICVISDTHFGNIHNQLHLVNEVYQEAYNRGIQIVLHVGDMVDGFYPNRPENPRQQFLHGYDQQVGYVKEMYPYIEGITTFYILGSHDETHYKNGQATVNFGLEDRKDMVYLGQDVGEKIINNVKILLDHPGGGSSQYLSYKAQKRIEGAEPHEKPNILLIGHYHKSYAFLYRNIQGILVPCLCGMTQFQQKQGLQNVVGAYFLDIYADKKGHIQYFEPEEVLFGKKDLWDEAGKDKGKVKKLVIPHGIY